LLAGAAGMGGVGTIATPWSLRLRRRRFAIRGLPPVLEGLRVVHIADTHLGPRIPGPFIESAVGLALSLKPDLVGVGGDYIHLNSTLIGRAAALFRPLCEALPGRVVGVLGNHDHWCDGEGMAAAMRAIGVRMIDNDRVFLQSREGPLLA